MQDWMKLLYMRCLAILYRLQYIRVTHGLSLLALRLEDSWSCCTNDASVLNSSSANTCLSGLISASQSIQLLDITGEEQSLRCISRSQRHVSFFQSINTTCQHKQDSSVLNYDYTMLSCSTYCTPDGYIVLRSPSFVTCALRSYSFIILK